jgi:hypothetical protein
MKVSKLYIIVAFILLSCESGFFPNEDKRELPEGHIVRLKTAFHKESFFYPYGLNTKTGEVNCASSSCHRSDLRGGIARHSHNRIKLAPSCYQCHGKLWYNSDSIKVEQ